MVAVKDRVVDGDISVTQPSAMVKDLELHTFLPTIEDCIKLNNKFIILIARVLTDHFAAWKYLQECVPTHIPHKFSKETAMKSDIVCIRFSELLDWVFVILIATRLDPITPIGHYFSQ